MDFIIATLGKPKKMKVKFTICLLLMLIISGISCANNYVMLLNVTQKENILLVSPHLNFITSDQIKEAIDNGTRIKIIAKAHLYEPHKLWFDTTIESKKKVLEISYFTLSKLYVVKNNETGEQLGFNDYDQLWKEFEMLASFEFAIPSSPDLWVKLRLVLDTGALPTVMQLPVLIDSNWDIDTAWQTKKIVVQ